MSFPITIWSFGKFSFGYLDNFCSAVWPSFIRRLAKNEQMLHPTIIVNSQLSILNSVTRARPLANAFPLCDIFGRFELGKIHLVVQDLSGIVKDASL